MKSKRKKAISYKLFLYVLPCILIVFIFNYFSIWGWAYAFFNYKPGKSLLDCEFVGLEHFKFLFGNPVMRKNLFRVLKNTIGIHLIGYLFTPIPMFFAIFLSEMKSTRFKKIAQTVTTLPHFIGWVVVYSMATSIFGTNGLLNNLLIELDIIEEGVNYLASNNHVWLKQVLWQEWKGIGWGAVVYFAAIAGVDQELHEAAMIDGAGKMARIWYITVPHLIPTYFALLIMNIGKLLNSGVDQYLAFSNAINRDSLEVLDLYVYNLGLGNGQISFSVAVGIMKSAVAFVLFGLANGLSKKVRGESVF